MSRGIVIAELRRMTQWLWFYVVFLEGQGRMKKRSTKMRYVRAARYFQVQQLTASFDVALCQ